MEQDHSNHKVGEPTPQEIISALEDPKYRGRTIKGIAQELGYEPESVTRVITPLFGDVMRLCSLTQDGRSLYITRRHWRETTPFWSRVMAALRNRAD